MLSEEARAAGYTLIHRSSVGSTMDEARALIGEGMPASFWVVADEQSGGRGRHGRQWSSPRGNLYATLALTEPCDPAIAPQLGFVAGVALHRAIAQVTELGASELCIKWPNDLLLNNAKVAGLLLEGATIAGVFRVLIGFGVNIASAPTGTPYPAAVLGASEPTLLMRALSSQWLAASAEWRTGFANTRRSWLERAALIGEEIAVRPRSGEVRGVMRGIDESGRLLLDAGHGAVTIDAGDVFPL